jgi:flagellar biosynthesis protein FlhA
MAATNSSIVRLLRQADLWFIVGLFGTLMLLVFPVPSIMLDLLLAVSIALSLLTVLVILYLREPSDFTAFPTLLLITTLFRLGLNVASTRLILLDGFAGHIIEAFGNFAVGGNFVVGLVVFIILVLINFVVITKGAGRIAEVAARFTLDALPGKQMAIDAELNAGLIDEGEARRRRRRVEQEADFYGAMDGASKFVRGDAIAAILITLVNLIGGFAVGVAQRDLPLAEALRQYTLLSIGDGLVSQVPALITSTAAAILVTRAAAKTDLGHELGTQLLFSPRALVILSTMLGLLSLVPGLPTFPFLVLAVITGSLSYAMRRWGPLLQEIPGAAGQDDPKSPASKSAGAPGTAEPGAAGSPVPKPGGSGEKLETLLQLDSFQIELGYALVSLADVRKRGDLLERVTGVRRTFAQEMGVIIPPIRLRDNLQLASNEYRFILKGMIIAKGELMPGYLLAMNATQSKVSLKGVPTVEPVFQLPATWITEGERKTAELAGYSIVDAASVLVTHLSEALKRHCHEILSRQDVQVLLDNLKQTHATVVNELIPAQMNVGQVQRILQNLLAEGISIRNLAGILEKVSDYASVTKNPDELSEQARRVLGAQITRPYQIEPNRMRAITLDPRLEQQIAQFVRHTPNEITLALEPRLAKHIVESLSRQLQQLLAAGYPPVVLCAPSIRLAFRRFFEATFSDLAVVSYAEVPSKVDVLNTAVVPALAETAQAA